MEARLHYAFYGLFYVPAILGILLLIQTERMSKRMKQAQPAQAMVK
jgi:hypothetical protein